LKILYVTSKGGIHDYRFLNKLAEEHNVLLLHYSADDLIPEIKNIKNIKIISKKAVFRSFPILSELFHFKKIVKEFQPDIIHTGYAWQVGALAAYSGVHPHLSMPWGSDILTEPDSKLILKKIVKKVIRSCDHVQCDADYVKEKIIKDYGIAPDKITVFPWGIDLGLFKKEKTPGCRNKLSISSDKFVMIFNRYLEEVYGVEFMLEAFNAFAKDKKDVVLLMVSDGSLKETVQDYIKKHGLEKKVRMIGKVPNTQLPAILNCADVYISTSLSDGTSLSLLEALACGLGVIVTDVPAIKEWVNDENGILVKIKDTAQIAEAMEKYYINRQLITQHGDKNIQIAKERADWDKNYGKLNLIYQKILNRNG
jgi:glycosyltransferase involved in cell wall biosynthesis